MTASANSALDRIGVMVVTGGGPFVPPFWTAAEDALIPADGWSAAVPLAPSAVPLEPFSEGMMTVSASVSMSGRDVGAGPKTDRFLLLACLSEDLPLTAAAGPAASAWGVPTPAGELLPKTRRRLPRPGRR